MSFAKVDLYFALAVEWLGIQHKLLWIVAQATCRSRHNSKGLAATDPSSVQGLRRDQGIGRTSCPVSSIALVEKRPRRRKKEVNVLAALAGLDDSDDDDSSSTISSLFWRLFDGYVRERFHVGKPILSAFLSRPAIEPRLPSPAGQEGIPCLQEWSSE
ncbi:hypothetical protein GWK47_054347 [Chionoecetes opilio]|uniref:Uncharacterized protein n=1 Tax=Chionoecetes opilio TaxID=41210 RepID=A0A8J5CQ17_CHIOP|nr:hypothetical protein GWK47_054347 [Chionoecetes opilio]